MALVITFIEPRKDKPLLSGVKAPVEKYQMILLNHALHEVGSLRDLSLISLRWIKSLLYYKNGQEEYSK